MNNDAIFALSSGAARAGVSVIRISGSNLKPLMTQITARQDITPRHAYFTHLRDGDDLIDDAIVIYFAAPHSFTGEDIIEIHTHGAPAVISRVFEYLRAQGLRIAQAGEFSRRAFYNNKMDLTDVDGLAALLNAQTERQRRAALQSMTGGDGKIYNAWREQMIEIAAYAAAMLDYADDELPKNIGEKITVETQKLYNEIKNAISRYAAVRAIRSGFNVVLVGDTNVGKSSLFNAILGDARAIVSDTPRTTRDVITASVDIDGFMVNLCDTAGLRETDDEIEKMGIEKTNSEIQNADITIRVFNNDAPVPEKNEICVINKSDLLKKHNNKNAIYVSAKSGDGIDKLINKVRDKMREIAGNSDGMPAINERTRELLLAAADELKSAIAAHDAPDIMAEHIRHSADNIGRILGTITADEIMDATFSQLCLGK